MKIGVDGEALVLDPPLVFETRPSALRVRLPRHAPGRSPTARAVRIVRRSTVSDLGRIVLGRSVAEDR